MLRDFFIYKNLDTSQEERQFEIRFYIQKSDTLRYVIFIEFLKFAERGEGRIYKNNAL